MSYLFVPPAPLNPNPRSRPSCLIICSSSPITCVICFRDLMIKFHERALLGLYYGTTALKKNRFGKPKKKVETVGVLGAGLMGAGVAQVTSQKAKDAVLLKDVNEQVRKKKKERKGKGKGKREKKKKMNINNNILIEMNINNNNNNNNNNCNIATL